MKKVMMLLAMLFLLAGCNQPPQQQQLRSTSAEVERLSPEIQSLEKQVRAVAEGNEKINAAINELLTKEHCGLVWAIQTPDGQKQSLLVATAEISFRQLEEGEDVYKTKESNKTYFFSPNNFTEEALASLSSEMNELEITGLEFNRGNIIARTSTAISWALRELLDAKACGVNTMVEFYHLGEFGDAKPLLTGPLEDWFFTANLRLDQDQKARAKRYSTGKDLCFTFVSMKQDFNVDKKKAVIKIGIKDVESCPASSS